LKNTKSFLSAFILVIGIFFLVLVLISAYLMLISFIERQSYGPGLLFADVELFAFTAIIFGVLGFIFLYLSGKIKRSN
jgi:hypothetical protein